MDDTDGTITNMSTQTITPNTYIQEFDSLRVTSLTREMHERTCGYWYTVNSGAMAHTAFRTREDLDVWLVERGLSLVDVLSDAPDWSTIAIAGGYRKSMDRDVDRFNSIVPILVTQVMDNGRLTPAKITQDDGVRTVHFMNVNYR